jgi:hypothetical protein
LDAECALLHNTFDARSIAKIVSVGIGLFSRKLNLSPIELTGIVGTGGHASAAADAPIIVYDDDTVGFCPGRFDRTALDTGRVFAVLAGHGQVEMSFVGNFLVIVVHIGMHEIDALRLFHFQDSDIVDLRIAGLIVLFHASINAFAATDAAGNIKTIAEEGFRKGLFG